MMLRARARALPKELTSFRLKSALSVDSQGERLMTPFFSCLSALHKEKRTRSQVPHNHTQKRAKTRIRRPRTAHGVSKSVTP